MKTADASKPPKYWLEIDMLVNQGSVLTLDLGGMIIRPQDSCVYLMHTVVIHAVPLTPLVKVPLITY